MVRRRGRGGAAAVVLPAPEQRRQRRRSAPLPSPPSDPRTDRLCRCRVQMPSARAWPRRWTAPAALWVRSPRRAAFTPSPPAQQRPAPARTLSTARRRPPRHNLRELTPPCLLELNTTLSWRGKLCRGRARQQPEEDSDFVQHRSEDVLALSAAVGGGPPPLPARTPSPTPAPAPEPATSPDPGRDYATNAPSARVPETEFGYASARQRAPSPPPRCLRLVLC